MLALLAVSVPLEHFSEGIVEQIFEEQVVETAKIMSVEGAAEHRGADRRPSGVTGRREDP